MLEKRAEQLPELHEPEVEAFADFLNQLFTTLATSLTRYAARVKRDKGSVSRYLNGRRIAPEDFVDELLRQVAELTGNPVTDDVRVQAYQLRLEALRVRNPSQHELEQLRESLGAAERELHLANVRERALLKAVVVAEERATQAEQRYRQLESDWATVRYTSGSAELDIYTPPEGADELRGEIRDLKTELEALRSELSRAQALKLTAEEQCVQLESRLLAAEATLQMERTRSHEGSTAGPEQSEQLDRPWTGGESEPYVRLATFRTLQRVVADLNAAGSLAGTLQAVVEGAVHGLGFDVAAVSLVRPDGDLVVAAVWELEESPMGGPSVLLGQVGSRESWDRLLNASDHWGTLRFLSYDRGWAVASDFPRWIGEGPLPIHADDWHPQDILCAPLHSAGGDLLGVLSVDHPRSGKRPGAWTREALETFSLQASIAIGNARLRAEMQRVLARLEKDQQALHASEESFRQTFEYAPSGMAITELHGAGRGQLTRVNDALCRLLGRPRAVLRQHSLADFVHPEDRALLERAGTEAGVAEVRLSHRDGSYQRVCLRHSFVVGTDEATRFLITTVDALKRM
ncbi:GAF domain-containing protein [Kitasatospora sp. NPDC101155]|uniref:GAF domain-containing protein n=1 Tax=Kitasatospora sp. NPDC101155 TaxID=3364097 RepID=UPI00380AEADF